LQRVLQLLKYVEFMYYDVLIWLQEYYIAALSTFTCNFLLHLLSSRPIVQNVEVLFKTKCFRTISV